MSDAPEILLAHHLKALKLPTFLREHQKLARQCAAEGLDHVRYLARLVELELIDRERRMVERRIKAAKLSTAVQYPATRRSKIRPRGGDRRHGARAYQIAGACHGALAPWGQNSTI